MIKKDAMGDYVECSKLSGIDVIGATATGILAFLLVVTPTFIRHFHLTNAQSLILEGAGNAIKKGLAALDALSFTSTLVTFLFWGLVGIVVYGITSGLVRLWQAGEESKELVSDEYVHPTGFSRRQYVGQVVEKEVFSAAVLIAELITISTLLFWALPLGRLRVESFLGSFTPGNALSVVISIAVITALCCLAYVLFKAWRYRHILFVV